MKISAVRSDSVYAKIAAAPAAQKNDIYRYELMQPFQKKWDCYHIPLKAAKPGGYDVVMASEMLGHLSPGAVDASRRGEIALLADDALWSACERAIAASLERFRGVELSVRDYLFTLLLADPGSPYTVMNEGYCGDGGIPGYIMAWCTPNPYTIARLPAALAHETNHNVRFQFIRWRSDVTLGEMLVSEGLAENFATSMFGEELLGPWVAKTDMELLNEYVKPVVREGLGTQGLCEMNAYLYGDEMAALQSCPPVGLPYCAGYACGYYLVKYYLQKTGRSVEEATLLPAAEILSDAEGFWTSESVR